MNYLVIYNSPLDENISEFHKQIENIETFYRINHTTWLIHSDLYVDNLKSKLSESMGIRDHIVVFELGKKWAIANDLDLIDWLMANAKQDKF